MRSVARRYPLATYIALAYGLSWAYWIPLALRGAHVTPGGSETHFPGLLGPGLAAFIVTALIDGGAGVSALWRRLWLVSRPSGRFWLYTLSPVLFLLLALLIARWLHRLPPMGDLWVFSGLPRLPLASVLILVLLFNGYGEETGWRGFALSRLQARFGPVFGPVVLGLLWAGWHVPTFWTIEGYSSMTLPILVFGFGLGIICGSIVLAEVVDRTGGSVLAASVWHLTYNMTSATLGSRGVIGAVTTVCVQVWAFVIVVQRWRAHRALRAAGKAA